MDNAAGDKQVLKRKRRKSGSLSRMCCLAVAAGCAAIALQSAVRARGEEEQRDTAVSEAGHMMAALAHARGDSRLQQQQAEAALGQLRDQLAAAQAAAAHPPAVIDHHEELDRAREELSAAGATNTRLAATIDQQRVALAAIPELQAKLGEEKRKGGELQATADGLQSEIDEMKSQLLAAAARDSGPAQNDTIVEADAGPVGTTRWALGLSYDASKAFAALCFDRDSLRMADASGAAGEEGLRESVANRTASGATFRFTHDRSMQRVYAASLTVPLVQDGPKDRVTENIRLVTMFLHTFAPAMKNGDVWVAAAGQSLSGKDSSQRVETIDSTYKVTAFNDGHGVYTFRVESPHADLDE